eukprot:TRINITY_DN24183_c0_g1_i2.p3 TRINITY_DN24183_c0_g1~~TRINITY_DN24183_c0_g1_i2.p3  ORF type:complete len:115 (-),score=1.29 TRINITY_DN24183_c0_g1_i2:501-845(-)
MIIIILSYILLDWFVEDFEFQLTKSQLSCFGDYRQTLQNMIYFTRFSFIIFLVVVSMINYIVLQNAVEAILLSFHNQKDNLQFRRNILFCEYKRMILRWLPTRNTLLVHQINLC